MIPHYLEILLRKWGNARTSVNLGYPEQCPYFIEWIGKTTRSYQSGTSTEVDKLADIIEHKLSRDQYKSISAKYRDRDKHGRMLKDHSAARQCGFRVYEYRGHIDGGVKIIEINLS